MTVLLTMLALYLIFDDKPGTLKYFRTFWWYHLIFFVLALPFEILILSRLLS